MSGHSHWATIRRKKSATDAKKGKLFSKYARIISLAVKQGGPDLDTNVNLKYAIDRAKSINMPNDNIERAIKKASGEDSSTILYELVYEGYVGGVAFLIEALTDNKNRTASDVRHALESFGGSLAGSGAVAWMFESKGMIGIPRTDIDEDALMEIVLEAGAEDMQVTDEMYDITCAPHDLENVKQAITGRDITIEGAQLGKVPQNFIDIDQKTADKINRMIEKFDDNEDVQEVYHNANMPDPAE